MKKLQLVALLLGAMAITWVGLSCKKSKPKVDTTYTCTTCTTTPEAKAANDNSGKGIYKGVFIGSTGTIKFDIENSSSNTLTASLVIDGVKVNLMSQVSFPASGPYIAPFFGTLNGQSISVTFSVGANGSSPSITASSIPGHPNASFVIAKETSSNILKCYEGTYTKTNGEKGTFNATILTYNKTWSGNMRKDGETNAITVSGPYANSTLYFDSPSSGLKGAVVKGDVLEGTFEDRGDGLTVKAKRTL